MLFALMGGAHVETSDKVILASTTAQSNVKKV